MLKTIAKFINRECIKHIRRFHMRIAKVKKDRTRFRKRTGMAAGISGNWTPTHWALDDHFNPFYVRSRIKCISHAVALKIRNGTYSPKPYLQLSIPKKDGGRRTISVFTIVDSAIANMLYRRLLNRNLHLLSDYAFAYRYDRNALNAIEYLYRNIHEKERLFVIEYDYRKYFDSISHNYINSILDGKMFKVSKHEKSVIMNFMQSRYATSVSNYEQGLFTPNTQGTPQGSSLSLLIANLAATELDRQIERTGAVYARFADDTVVISNSFEQANNCARSILAHEHKANTSVNFKKSDGISLLTNEHDAEFRSKTFLDFLGYSISYSGITISEKSLSRIKSRLSTTIYQHLVMYIRRHNVIRGTRVNGGVDWDLVTCINALRGYIYGNISESEIQACLQSTDRPLTITRGLMMYYALVTNKSVLKMFDGWVINALERALKYRRSIITGIGHTYNPPSRESLLAANWYNVVDIPNEVKIPSFVTGWNYARKCLYVYGYMKLKGDFYNYG